MTTRHDTDRDRTPDGLGWNIRCVHCRQWFEAKRGDASFCSAACRVGYQRAQAQLQADIAYIPSRARQMRQLAEKNPRAAGMFEALMKAQAEIQKAIAACEYSEEQITMPLAYSDEQREDDVKEFFTDLTLMTALQEERDMLISLCGDTTLAKRATYRTRIAEINEQLKKYS